jgi:hypothetical protein
MGRTDSWQFGGGGTFPSRGPLSLVTHLSPHHRSTMLKAALAGLGKGSDSKQQDSKLDSSSFPCIDERKALPDDVSDFADLSLLRGASLAGSMPVGVRAGSYKGSVSLTCWSRARWG